jgi:lysophospholipase L1-like esterase
VVDGGKPENTRTVAARVHPTHRVVGARQSVHKSPRKASRRGPLVKAHSTLGSSAVARKTLVKDEGECSLMASRRRLLATISAVGATLLALSLSAPVSSATSSSGDHSSGRVSDYPSRTAMGAAVSDPGDRVITFSRYPTGTAITSQYRGDGIDFGGKSPFIADDNSNPNSPVLAGTPKFFGAITGKFVTVSGFARPVTHFSVDVGYIDDPLSTAVTAYNSSGAVIESQPIGQTGIVTVSFNDPDIASFRVAATANGDKQGFAIDNVTFPPAIPAEYVAMGDSYSSGEGNPPFDSSTATSTDSCHRSADAWPRLLVRADPALRPIAHIACSGATSAAITGEFNGEPSQLSQLKALSKTPSLVTITLGGNDIGFSKTLIQCVLIDCWRDGAISRAKANIENNLPGLLKTVYADIAKAEPSTRIVVVGYPRLFPTTQNATVNCGWLTETERKKLNGLARLLNTTIADAAVGAHDTYVPTLNVLSGHELCTKHSWMYPLGVGGGQKRGHPTLLGQRAMEAKVLGSLG